MGAATSVVIRPARPEDAAAIAFVHVRSWQQTYQGQVPDDYLNDLHKDMERREQNMLQLLAESQQWKVFVAEKNGAVVGFCLVGPDRDDPTRGEIGSIYLLSEYWGQGIGYALHQAGLSALSAMGLDQAVLWILDTNERTRKWYKRQGWQPDGAEKRDDRGSFVLNEVRYVKRIGLGD